MDLFFCQFGYLQQAYGVKMPFVGERMKPHLYLCLSLLALSTTGLVELGFIGALSFAFLLLFGLPIVKVHTENKQRLFLFFQNFKN